VINAFEKAADVKLDYKIGARRPGDIEKIFGDVSKAEAILGWKTELDLDEMMRSAWAWEKYLQENPL
jgi:UDP-glucose 4-epimerase